MILFGWAVCGTLGGGFPEKLLPFNCSVRLTFLFGLSVSNHLFRAWNRAILDVCGSKSISSELLLVTPLAFSLLLIWEGHCSWEGVQVLKSS